MIRTLSLAALVAAIAAPSAFAQQPPQQQPPQPPQQQPPQLQQPQQPQRQQLQQQQPQLQQPQYQQPQQQRPATQRNAPQGSAARLAINDSLFAAAAATGGTAELSLSELGLQRATDPELKRFSQQMIDEHTRMNQELWNAAAQRGIAVPRGVDARAQFCAQSLAGLSGEEFDRCYAKAQLVAHMDSVAIYEAEAERGMDPTMKALASRSLSRIREHLKTIKPIAMKFEKEKEHEGEPGAAPEKQER